MRCSAYECINNDGDGYCSAPDYVEIDELFDILKTCIRKGPKTKEFRDYVRISMGLMVIETVTNQKVRD